MYDPRGMCVPYGTTRKRHIMKCVYLLNTCTLQMLRDRKRISLIGHCVFEAARHVCGVSVPRSLTVSSTSGFWLFQDKIILPVLQDIIIPFCEKLN